MLSNFFNFPQDVFILDAKDQVFVWIGRQTSVNEKKNAMAYAHVSGTFFKLCSAQLCHHLGTRNRYFSGKREGFLNFDKNAVIRGKYKLETIVEQ